MVVIVIICVQKAEIVDAKHTSAIFSLSSSSSSSSSSSLSLYFFFLLTRKVFRIFSLLLTLDSDAVGVGIRLGYVANPTTRGVTGFVVDSEESYVDTRRGKHRHLEFRRDRRATPHLLPNRRHQLHVRRQLALAPPVELLDAPDNGALLRLVFRAAEGAADAGAGGVGGDGDLEDEVRGE